jgi:glutathione synthase/RimK-type ligase-like ATP-grasp enzyme
VKLVLANNQRKNFTDFYGSLQADNPGLFDHSPYKALLFVFDSEAEQPVVVKNLATGKQLGDYDGIYINGYLDTYELAATVAICCQALQLPFYNRELANAPSLSKLTSYAKLAAKRVCIPQTYAGAQAALLQIEQHLAADFFPAVLKRADADRGIDNFKVSNWQEVATLLEPHDDRSIWLLQRYLENDGYYLVSFYDSKPAFCIFRSLEERPDGNAQKAHMFKPAGGANARLLALDKAPSAVLASCQQAIETLNRQIGSVDCIYDQQTGKAYILEVNYNPQLVTIETFKDVRIQAFVESLKKTWL